MRNSLPVEQSCAENDRDLSMKPKLGLQRILRDSLRGRGAFQMRRSHTGRSGGAFGSEYAGTSSDKTGENPVRRKPKVSRGR